MATRLEAIFAKLAYHKLKENAPALLNYTIGFQLIDKNEDETRAVGVYGFKVGNEWLLGPNFYMNGKLKGDILLYVKSQNSFVPMQDSWVNYLISRRPLVLGTSDKRTAKEIGFMQPDLSIFEDTDFFKKSNALVKNMFNDPKCDLEFSDLFVDPNCDMLKQSSERLDLITFLRRNPRYLTKLANSMLKDEKFAEAILKYYDINDIASIPLEAGIKQGMRKPKMKKHSENDKVEITVTDYETPPDTNMAEVGTTRVIDGRELESTSNVFDPTMDGLTNPTHPGFYEVIMKDGKIKEMAVFNNAITSDNSSILYDESADCGGYLPNKSILITDKIDGSTQWDKFFEKLPEPSADNMKDEVILVNENGEAVVVNLHETPIVDSDSRIWVERACIESPLSYCYDDDEANPTNIDKIVNAHINDVMITTMDGPSMTVVNGTLYVPNGYKVIKLKNSWEAKEKLRKGLADEASLEMAIKTAEADLSRLKIYTDRIEWFISADDKPFMEPMSKESALISLVKMHGIYAPVAAELIKQAQAKQTCRVLIKYAAGYPLYASNLLSMLDNADSYDAKFNTSVKSPRTITHTTDTTEPEDDSEPIMPDEVRELATTLSRIDQKEVLDTTVLSGLVNKTDVDGGVNEFIKDMMLGLDRVGRILFMYYWHYDKFADRYGKQDLPELEDSLVNAFRILGDLVLFLKQKTIDTMPGEDEAEIDLETTSEPL